MMVVGADVGLMVVGCSVAAVLGSSHLIQHQSLHEKMVVVLGKSRDEDIEQHNVSRVTSHAHHMTHHMSHPMHTAHDYTHMVHISCR